MINYLENHSNRFYVKYMLANHCMPTLLNKKPSSLLSFQKKYIPNAKDFFITLYDEILAFHAHYMLLYENEAHYFVFIFQKKSLDRVIQRKINHKLFCKIEYQEKRRTLMEVLFSFRVRYQKYQEGLGEFPHEVGILLGYPIADVEGYIRNNGENYQWCGYWKVYHNVEKAKKTAYYFQEIRKDAVSQVYLGKPLSELKK